MNRRVAFTGISRRDLRPEDWQTIWPELADQSAKGDVLDVHAATVTAGAALDHANMGADVSGVSA